MRRWLTKKTFLLRLSLHSEITLSLAWHHFNDCFVLFRFLNLIIFLNINFFSRKFKCTNEKRTKSFQIGIHRMNSKSTTITKALSQKSSIWLTFDYAIAASYLLCVHISTASTTKTKFYKIECGTEHQKEREREKGKRMVHMCVCVYIYVCVCVCECVRRMVWVNVD